MSQEIVNASNTTTRSAQSEMRGLIFELHRTPLESGLVAALSEYAAHLSAKDELVIDVRGPLERLPVSRDTEAELFGIGREALANVVKHAGASTASVRVEPGIDKVVVEIRDDGHGFDPAGHHPGHYGLESMQGRADAIGARLTISSAADAGTLVRVETSVDGAVRDGA